MTSVSPSTTSSSTISASISSASSVQSSVPTMVHVCPFQGCTKGFSKKYNLKAHLRLHTGATPFSCPRSDCDKKFKWRSSLSSHSVWHQRQEAGEELAESASKAFSSNPRKGDIVEPDGKPPRDLKADKHTKHAKQAKSAKAIKSSSDRKALSPKKQKQRVGVGAGMKENPATFMERPAICKPESSLLSEMLIPSPSDTTGPLSVGPGISLPLFDRASQGPQRRGAKTSARRRPASRPSSVPDLSALPISASTPTPFRSEDALLTNANNACAEHIVDPSSNSLPIVSAVHSPEVALSSTGLAPLCGAKRSFSEVGGEFPVEKRDHLMGRTPMSQMPMAMSSALVSTSLDAACEASALIGVPGVGSDYTGSVAPDADPGSPVTSTDDVGIFHLGPVLNEDYGSDMPFLGGSSVADLQSLSLCGLGPLELDIPLEYEP